MMVHLINFIVYTTMFVTTSGLIIICDGKNARPGQSVDLNNVNIDDTSVQMAKACYSLDVLGFL